MAYLTYEEYENLEYDNTVGSTLSEAAFNDLEYEARMYINWVTFNRLKNETVIPAEVKECVYHIIKLIKTKMELLNHPVDSSNAQGIITAGGIAGMSNDGVSITYNTLTARELLKSNQKQIEDIVKSALQGVRNSLGHRLLYRGIYPDEGVI